MDIRLGLSVLAVYLLFMHTDGQTPITRQTCNRIQGNQAIIQPNADAFITGFFAMHNSGTNGVGCGGIKTQEMQSYEAIRWALDRLNKKGEYLNLEFLNDSYIPGVQIGMIANNYCSNPDQAISMAESIFPQFGSSPHECQKNTNKLMLGLMGASSSGDTKVLEKYAEDRQLPLVSYTSSAPELSDSGMFPNFLRTIPPDGPLTKTITDFIKNIKWEYVTVVYTDNAYGMGAYKALRPHLAAAGICLTYAISADPDDNSDASVDAILRSVLQTYTTGVIYLGNDFVIDAILKRGEAYPNAGKLQWVVTDSVALSDKFSGQKYPRGLVSVVPAGRKITEFEDHWVRINNNVSHSENPWYQDMYMARFRCRLPGKTSTFATNCPVLTEDQRRNDYVQDQFVEPAVHAVFTYARALKKAHAELCGAPGMCTALRSLSPMDFYTKYMRSLEFIYGKAERVESLASYSLDPYNAAARLKYIGNDINNPSFEVFSFNGYPYEQSYRFWSVATYINQLLEVLSVRLKFYNEARNTPLLYIPKSSCPSTPCRPCLGAIEDPKYVYIPGDIVITSAFSVHPAGQAPFSCGKFDLNSDDGIQAMQAFLFAINYVNSDVAPSKGWLKGVKLGGLGFDDCENSVISNQLITEVHRYSRAIRDPNGENLLDPRRVEAFLAPWLATDLTELMNTLKRPIVGVQTLSTKFNDFEMYPYFVRATYDYEYVSRAFVNIVKKNGWRYIQVVYDADEEGNEANRILRKVAAEEGICVIASYGLHTANTVEVVSGLRKSKDVKPVVLFLRRPGMQLFAQGLKVSNSTGEFQFMSASGNSMKTVQGYEKYFKGLISFELWNGPSMDAFDGRLKVIDVRNYVTNPWLKEWYELFYNCSFNPMGGQTACGNENLFSDARFELNSDNIAVIYGVIAAAQGLDETVKHYCGVGYNGLCGEFLNARDKGKIFVDYIVQKTRYSADINVYYTFNSMRMGNIPYVYYNFHQFDTGVYGFTKIGDYGPAEDKLALSEGVLILPASQISSTCPGICMECLYLFGYQKFMYVDGDLIIPAIFDVHYRGDSPYSCSSLRVENGFQYSEAFRFALMKINNGGADVKLNGVRLGGLGFDGCTDHIRASAVVTGMYSGAFPTPNSDLADKEINTGDLMGWLSYDSQTTVDVSRILQRQGVPSVTPGATTPVLDDKTAFTTFFRTIPSDGIIALAMAKLSNLLGFSYVITLNSPDSGNRDAVDTFRKYANGLGICVGASYEFATDGDITQIFRYITESSTRVVVVFASPDMYIEDLIRHKNKSAGNESIIFITNHPWTVPAQKVKAVGKSIIPATLSFNMDGLSSIPEFMEFLKSESRSLIDNPNPWFREYFEAVMQCNLAGTSKYNRNCDSSNITPLDLNRITQDLRVIPTIHAVNSIAEGVHRTLKAKCGVNYTGICPAFVSDEQIFDMIMAHMDEMSFRDVAGSMFNFIKREANQKLTITQIQTNGEEKQVGTFEFGELNIPLEETLKANYINVPSKCVGECAQCKKDSTGEEEFIYIAGEVHIAALFDIHKMGNTPYTCGEINGVHGFQLMEAFNWAMNYVNTKQGMFSDKLLGVKLGSLIFDTCSSPVRAGNLVANYHARNFQISTTDYKIDPSLIDLYIGPMTSEASIRVADVLNELGIPQIGYGASSVELMDKENFPYFIRTVPADDKQARALISVLKKYKFDNIQLISQNSSDGEHARDEFLRLAPLNKICVSQQFVIGQDGNIKPDDAKLTLEKLQQKPDARVVVVIMNDPMTLLQEANKLNFILNHGFAFIATDKLGFGMAGYENLAGVDRLIGNRTLITLEVESADYPEVDAYLEDKKPSNYQYLWFREYYEYIYNCSTSIPTARYPRVCNQYTLGYSRAEQYIQDPYTLYVINAVFAAALGIDKTIIKMCGPNNGICPILLDNGEKRDMFLRDIKSVRFTDRTNQPFYFTEDGSSDRGFHLYEPQAAGMSLHAGINGYYWEDIGSYNDSHYLKMDIEYTPNWNSSCSNGKCLCVFPEYQPSRYMKKPSPNDLNIVFVSNIHGADPNGGCGSIDTGSNMQNLLAFLYAIELVNSNKELKFQASLKLGGVALDTCSQPSRIGEDVYSLLSGEPFCGDAEGGQVVSPSSVVAYMVGNSANSIALSSMLSPLQITLLSMSATSVDLNDKLQHPYFLRTVPPDNVQAMVITQILKKFSWDYVSLVYSDNTYGRSARDTLLSQADPNNPQYCFHKTVAMPLNANLTEAKSVIDQLNQQIGSRVVVTFVTSDHVTLLLQATTEKGLNHRFIWIGSDTWANNYRLTSGYEETAAGAITIQIQSEFSQGLKNFVKNFTYSNPMGLPRDWFEEIYQTVHQCRILGSVIQKTYTSICTGNEVFNDELITQDAYVLHTIIAVFQIANGLNQIDQCRKSTSIGIASCLSTLDNRKQTIYDSVLNAQHDVLPNDLKDRSFNFKFTSEGYGDIGYNIYNFRRNLTSGQFEYIKIGSSTGDLRLDPRDYKSYSFTDQSIPVSRCQVGTTCTCEGTNNERFSFSRQESGAYVISEEGQYEDPNTGRLVTIEDTPQSADRFRDIWAVIVATLAAIGAFTTLCMFIYLLVVYPVRGGTTILGYMLCFGIILMYALVFAFIVHASTKICGLRRFALGFVYSIAYSAIFVKLIDCWRTKDKEDIYMVKYNKIGNPWGLFFSACLLVLVQVMINAEWLILEAPNMERVIYNNMLWPRCVPNDFYDEGLIMSNLFIMSLIFLSIIVGLVAFGNEKNNWDCRWLAGCVVLTVPCWMVWCLVAALGEYKVRDAAVAISLLYNATVMLMCGPLRKLYLLNKYQVLVEEEERKSQQALGGSQRDYNSMYGAQYDNAPHLHDNGSIRGSYAMGHDDVFMYDAKM